jgi:hypothetical protein
MEETVVVHEERLMPRGYQISLRAHRAYRSVFYGLWIIEVFLAFRFLLKLLGANPSNLFAKFIYGMTGILMFPFRTLFSDPVFPMEEGMIPSLFEPSTLFAMIVYAVIAWTIARFIILSASKPHGHQ